MNKQYLGRLPKDADLIETLNALCAEHGIERGVVQVIGALQKAKLGYYIQAEQRYVSHEVNEAVEILTGVGNVSLKDGKPFVHLHLTLSREDYSCLGGHTMPGCVIFAAEASIIALDGPSLIRELDTATGLPLWKK
jgi:predicted DNA-binding protein with PD1-like motif